MEETVFGLGCTPSIIDGTEYEFDFVKGWEVPNEYSFKDQMPPVLNQGSTNMCVTYSVGAHLDWNLNMDTGNQCQDNHIDRKEIYSARTMPGDNGMTFKEAFKFIRDNGVDTDLGKVKIDYYARIGGVEQLKQALIVNGPCMGGMMCYNNSMEFWKKFPGDSSLGGHAISIVGYNKDGFIIRNSWGKYWGKGGYALLKYKDFGNLFECWTIVD